MTEVREAPVNPAGFDTRETTQKRSAGRSIKDFFQRRLKKFVNRSEPAGYLNPKQLREAYLRKEKEERMKAERDKRKGEEGCLYRSLITAAVRASDAKNIRVKSNFWHGGFEALQKIIPTDEEYDERFKQMNEGPKLVEKLNEDIIKLFEKLQNANPPTDLSRALQNLKIAVNAPESIEAIKDRIKDEKQTGEQVLVYRPDPVDNKKAHILHAVLDKNGQLMSLSDPITQGKKTMYPSEEKNLSQGKFWTFSITPEVAIPSNANRTQLSLAA